MTAQHVVTMPDRSPHRAVKIGDAHLLLMDSLASVRAGTRLVVFDPPVDPSVCEECAAAYGGFGSPSPSAARCASEELFG